MSAMIKKTVKNYDISTTNNQLNQNIKQEKLHNYLNNQISIIL